MLNFKSSKRRGQTKPTFDTLSGTRPLGSRPADKRRDSSEQEPTGAISGDLTNLPYLRSGSFMGQPKNNGTDELSRRSTRSGKRGGITRLFSFKLVAKLVMVAAVFFMATTGFLAFKTYITSQKIFDSNDRGVVALNLQATPEDISDEGDGRINILLAGKGGALHDGGDLTDSLVIASIDPFSKTATLLSVPRDLYVDVSGLWSMKINATYSAAKTRSYDQSGNWQAAETDGLNKLSDTLEYYLGIPIHYYVLVDFIAFESIIDTLGGLDIDIQNRLYDPTLLPEIFLDIYPGEQVFDGRTALYYVRSRATSPRGDFDRSQRQREVLLALREDILTARTIINPFKLNEILDTIGDNVRTNISVEDAVRLYEITEEIEQENISSISFVDDPILLTTSVIGEQSVVIPIAGVNDYREIKSFVRNKLIDGFINRENASITILNGSGITNLAANRAQELESYGYNVVEIANAPTSNYLSTILVVNNEDRPYTQKYLENRLDVTPTKKSVLGDDLEQYNSDFVIIIGIDESTHN